MEQWETIEDDIVPTGTETETVWYTYILIDPRVPIEEGIFYVGVTNNVKRRVAAHFSLREVNKRKNSRIKAIFAAGHVPIWRTVATSFSLHEAHESERHWIQMLLIREMPLTNVENVGREREGFVLVQQEDM